VVLLSVPLETISSAVMRRQVMGRVLTHLRQPAVVYDADRDGDVDLADVGAFVICLTGPAATYAPGDPCRFVDGNSNGRVDLFDFGGLQSAFDAGGDGGVRESAGGSSSGRR
jgi:hypothetical protein